MRKYTKSLLLKNNRGVSIVESVITMGILTFIALVAASLINDLMKLNRSVMTTSEANSTMTLLAMFLGDQNTCELNFVSLNTIQFDTANLNGLVIPIKKLSYPQNGSAPLEYIYNTEIPVTTGIVRISDANLSNITYINLTSQSAKLNIQFDKGKAGSGPQFINRSMYIKLESTVISGNVVKVARCIAGTGTITPPAPTPLPNGNMPPPMADIPDQLFNNLLAAVKSLPFDSKKVQTITATIKNWQSLALIGTDRYMSMAKVATLLKDGGLQGTSFSVDLCNFLSGHIIDPANSTTIIPLFNFKSNAVACSNYLGK